jgi:hypothetical protein
MLESSREMQRIRNNLSNGGSCESTTCHFSASRNRRRIGPQTISHTPRSRLSIRSLRGFLGQAMLGSDDAFTSPVRVATLALTDTFETVQPGNYILVSRQGDLAQYSHHFVATYSALASEVWY